ncbi:hypothetical protein TWF103_009705 [Orbilia oligospora]|uniref:Uncharacterized protein n=2 Tax=Orbilia oligospora TaxID=2813651 RepID=A0A7C8K4Z7_ORBOL|nr:hypothetical protein TWF103_009705 [Orbilia oligospora]KAF3138893.1 hypothetical protein TWF703_004434 [Orbilia oligospora]
MLPRRRIGAKALTWQTTRIQPSHQVRLLATQRPSLPKSVENNARVNTILKVQNAVAMTSSKLTLDNLTTDDQRRDYLWSRKEQISRILPGREWKKVFAIARRLFEHNYLIRPPADKEFRKRMLDNYGELLTKLEQTPVWLAGEIKMLEARDLAENQDAEEGLDTTELSNTTESVDEATPDALSSSKEEVLKDGSANTKTSDQVLVLPDANISEKTSGADAEDISRYRNLVISPESEPVKATVNPTKNTVEKPVSKSFLKPVVEDSVEMSAERFLEKKATESAKDQEKEIPPIQIIFPEYNKVIRSSVREEEITAEKLNQLQVPEDKISGAFEILQKLSRTLVTENVRPDLKPVLYPNQATYALLTEATTLLEEACFEFVKKRAPSVTSWPTFDCPEAQEYKRWVDLIIKLGKEHSKDGFKLPPKFIEGMSYGDIIRNSAAHRLPIHAPKLRELLRRARLWMEPLDVPEVLRKFERLEQSAAEMQTELEDDLSPVVEELRGVLSRIKGRWDKVKRLEDKILEIQKSIRMEKSGIELEEQNIQDSLRKAQGIRYERGQKFERQRFQVHVHGALVEASESKVEAEQLPEEWREDELIIEDLPVGTETNSHTTEKGSEVPGMEIPKVTSKTPFKPKEKTKAGQALGEAGHTSENQPKLERDYQGGLVSFEANALPDIEDVSLVNSKRLKQISANNKSKGMPAEVLGKGPSKADDQGVKEGPLGEEAGPEKTTSSENDLKNPKDAKKIGFEGSNLSRESDIESSKNSPTKWYNPLSWFK